MELYLKDIKKTVGRRALLTSEVIDALSKKYPNINRLSFNTAISRYIKNGSIFCSKPLTFKNAEYAITSGRTHDYSKYYPLINKHIPGLSLILKTIKYDPHYISIFNIKKLLAIDNNQQLVKAKAVINMLIDNVTFDGQYCYTSYPRNDDEQMLYEKNRDRLLYTLIEKHEKENIIFGHSVYYKTFSFHNISCAGISFDAYSKSNVLQANDKKKVYLVYDFAIDGDYTMVEATSFFKRIQKLSNKTNSKVVPVSIFKHATMKTIDFLKGHGIILIDFKSILGKEAESILLNLSKLDKEEYDYAIFDSVLKYLSPFEQFDGIKGGLFEHLCCAILEKNKTNEGTQIIKNYILEKPDSKKIDAQFDVLIKTYDNQTIICECKAYNTKVIEGKPSSKASLKYFVAQVDKYKNKYPDEDVKMIFFGANGFAASINKKNYKQYNNGSSEFKTFNLLISYENIKTIKNCFHLSVIWFNYFLNDKNKEREISIKAGNNISKTKY